MLAPYLTSEYDDKATPLSSEFWSATNGSVQTQECNNKDTTGSIYWALPTCQALAKLSPCAIDFFLITALRHTSHLTLNLQVE